MNFKQENIGQLISIRAVEDGTEVGIMTCKWSDTEKFIIEHTNVNPDFKGRNIGKQLVMEAVKLARENKLKIIPICPFAKSVFEKNSEIQDLL